MKPLAFITGAAGGVGLACARLLGRTSRLLLCDIDGAGLGAALDQLADEGYDAEGLAGDLADPAFIARAELRCAAHGAVHTIVNAAGLSPRQASWQAIVRANGIGPVRLLDAVEPWLIEGSACVMIASVAGHIGIADPAVADLLKNPLRPDLLRDLEPHLARLTETHQGSREGHLYSLTKRANIELCEQRAKAWGRIGARIMSVSPGLICTAMGRLEAAQGDRARALVKSTPLARWATPMEIATVAEFLLSDAAAFITGCDIRVDGGAVAANRGVAF